MILWLKGFLSGLGVVTAVVIVVAILIGVPFLVIWCLNVLLPYEIAYGFKEWFAVLVLMAVFGSSGGSK